MKILICGYIGGGNCGDEAICDRLASILRHSGNEVTLLSITPAESAALHNTPSLPRYSPAALRGIRESDLLILGGGTLLQEESSRRSALYYLGIAAAASALGTPWVLIGGIDPLSGKLRALAQAILPSARAFFLRDRDSLLRAEALAPTVLRFFVRDTAYLPLIEFPARDDHPNRPYLLLCPKVGVQVREVAPILHRAKKRGLAIVCLAMSREDEGICSAFAQAFGGVWVAAMPPCAERSAPSRRRVEASTVLPSLAEGRPHRYFACAPCEIACRLIKGAEEVYSARLHGLIFAQKAGVRAHILSDGTKQWKFSGFGQPNRAPPPGKDSPSGG